MCYLIAYSFAMSLGVIQTSWTIAGNNATAPVLIELFKWSEEQAIWYNTLINTCAMFGLAIGSITAGYSLKHGRNKAIIIWEIVPVIGCALTQVQTLPTICVGRLLIGVAAGVLNTCSAKSIDESVPLHLQGMFGASTNLMLNTGIMISLALGFILPTDPVMQA